MVLVFLSLVYEYDTAWHRLNSTESQFENLAGLTCILWEFKVQKS